MVVPCLPDRAGRDLHLFGIRQDRRSVGYGDQDTGVPFDLRAGIAERSAFRLFDLAVRRRADDGAHAAFQGAHPADLDFRAGFDDLLHGADLPERHVAAGRGLRLFRRCRQAHAVGDVRQKSGVAAAVGRRLVALPPRPYLRLLEGGGGDAPCSSSPWPWGWASTAMRICR